ncbi:MAG: Ribonuclease H [Candidatus Roizmanbacteria bacterium GW2011_GWA2_35_8]|uniref:Ribonuclease H n=1 Tax=Candidatus Roizmanbacteria bacterium GW2011_GWA2_35_8 TaxID=1618479 RepID=A0A0G0CYL2_9BACT|nr:MAG: Ribonuclease H [Candidatus Roizmanbacteria bacterium GW2011_GWA2_35_8]
MIFKVFTDGGSKGNPGPSSIGIVMKIGDKTVWEHHERIGIATNNDAEYSALIKALQILNPRFARRVKSEDPNLLSQANKFQIPNIKKIQFFSDSRLMVNQVNGLFKVKNGKIKEYILKIRVLEQEISLPITYSYIPREENAEADRLVNTP